MASVKGPGLYEFLTEAELQHYFNALKTELKVHNVGQLKFVTEEDLAELGMSRPEMRRLRKYFNKHCPQTYLSKMKKKLLQKKDSSSPLIAMPEDERGEGGTLSRPPSNKHIIPPDAIVINKELGVGEFGVVQQGIWTNEIGERIQVAIKCLSPDRLQSQPVEFLKEALIMHTINSEHIVRLYGVVLDSNSFMLVTELAPLGSLLECLREPSLRCSFPVTSLCHFSVQICDGMTYLEENRLIHRDLAARNILVFNKNKVKISDFGLSRALRVGKDYYQTNFNVNLKLPIAWCAPECINYLKFTSASDVWAFGVTLWEMFSYGFQPWPALTGHQILEAIDEPNFQRLEQPDYCPREYYSVMLQCWQHNPASRPKFAQLLTTLPEYSPEQVQAVRGSGECPPNYSEREWLCYSIGDVLTVLDKKVPDQHPNQPCLWKGILNCGKTGLFVPANTITYLGPNVPSNKPFQRGDGKNAYSSKRKLRSDMISGPQGDLKHTGHVGLDGAYFGDVGFLADKMSNVPQQVVNPYRPSEDQVVPSHDNTSSKDKRFESYCREPSRSSTSSKGSNDSFTHSSGQTTSLSREVHAINKNSARFKNLSRACSDISDKVPLLTRSNDKSQQDWEAAAAASWWNTSMTNSSLTLTSNGERSVFVAEELPADHQYTEISDEEEAAVEQTKAPSQPKSAFDLGPSLMDEVFGALERSSNSIEQDNGVLQPSPLDADVNVKNEIRELTINSKLGKKKPGVMKPISSCDEKTLDSAIAMANELACKSMLALNDEKMPASPLNSPPSSPSSPSINGAKGHNRFSFKFKNQSPKQQRRHFSEEVNSITDIQASITDQAKDVYNSLIGGTLKPTKSSGRTASKGTSSDSNPLRMLRAGLPVRPKVRGNKHNLPQQPQNTNRPASSAFRDSLSDTYGAFSTLPKGFKPGRPDSGLDPNTEEQLSNLSLEPSVVNGSTGCNNSSYHSMMSHNPLPLPPRDRTKAQSSSKPRHQRKHPLIMPLTSSLLRSSEKIESPSRLVIEHTHNPHLDGGEDQTDSNDSSPLTIAIDGYSSNGHNPPAKPPRLFSPALDDSFDSQVACEMDALDEVVNDATTLAKSENGETEESEPLLQSLMYSSGDHVSCEDLLEFALDKPDSRRTAGPQHGGSSDEVKLIRKILKNQVAVGDCMDALDGCDWDVHHALKLLRLLLLLPQYQQKEGLSAEELADARDILASFGWDVTKTASHIASLS